MLGKYRLAGAVTLWTVTGTDTNQSMKGDWKPTIAHRRTEEERVLLIVDMNRKVLDVVNMGSIHVF